MCGIGGILRTDGQPIPEEWLDAIDARIAYRGPDGHGRFRDRVEFTDDSGEKRVVEVAFVHRRLSIIDHKDGAQPMVSQRGRDESEGLIAVVFNGCIYNHRELRAELEAKGHRFVTDHSDTEVLIHGWREWGDDGLLDMLKGMYVFALWDRSAVKFAVARDWFGEKPVYTLGRVRGDAFKAGRLLAFSSSFQSIEAIRTDLENEKPIAPGISDSYLSHGYIPIQQMNVWRPHELPPAALQWWDRSDANVCELDRRPLDEWFPPETPPIEQLLDAAVASQLNADVPLGCFLSGGVDSSLIAHFAKKHKPDLMTFCVRMPDPRYDESSHAERVAHHLGTNHRTLDAAISPVEDLIHLIDILGQPFGDSSILPTYWVSKAAREHVKVALSGDGGDELFIGYERYMAAPFLARNWWWLRLLPASFLHGAHPKSKWNKFARLIDMARDYRELGLAAMESIFTRRQILDLTGSADRNPELLFVYDREPGHWHAIERLRRFDLLHYLPGDLLRKTDTASMAVALEVRCPYLDRDLARAVLAMPIEQLIPKGERKGLLKQIARKYLPREVVNRPKMGFAIPIGEWFRDDDKPHRGAGMKTLLLDHLNSTEPFGPIQLNQKAVQRFIDEHMKGGFRGRDHSHRLFTLLTLSIWAKNNATTEAPRH